MPVVTRVGRLSMAVVLVAAAVSAVRGESPAANSLVDELEKASAAYAEAFNRRDYAALADQWTARAELVEGAARLQGRDTIVASIRAWRERHPAASLAIQIQEVEPVAEPIARISGTMRFTQQPGATPVESRFTALRVKEGGTWRLAASRVTPAHVTALDELGWLLGTWQADAPEQGTIQITYEKALGGYAIIGRTTITPQPGKAALHPRGFEALEVIHADRDAGLIRSWVFDSTGARGDGSFVFDGTSFEKVMSGTPSDAVRGRRANWVQVIAPAGDGKLTTHMIERTIDGVGLPDAEPLNFKKIR
jgi:uncharacterized protein (TIGR02246 family)